MHDFDALPQARVVRKAGRLIAPPPAPREPAREGLGTQLRLMLGLMVGLWPLTGTVLLALGLLIIAGNATAP